MPKKKILFIEDEPDQVLMIELRLKRSGFAVVTAQDGEEGLKKVYEEKPDLILLDIIMPKMNGFEVCQQLKQNPATRKIPIIMTTAAGIDDIEQKCFLLGADDCVRKPYDSTDLLSKIKEFLKD